MKFYMCICLQEVLEIKFFKVIILNKFFQKMLLVFIIKMIQGLDERQGEQGIFQGGQGSLVWLFWKEGVLVIR